MKKSKPDPGKELRDTLMGLCKKAISDEKERKLVTQILTELPNVTFRRLTRTQGISFFNIHHFFLMLPVDIQLAGEPDPYRPSELREHEKQIARAAEKLMSLVDSKMTPHTYAYSILRAFGPSEVFSMKLKYLTQISSSKTPRISASRKTSAGGIVIPIPSKATKKHWKRNQITRHLIWAAKIGLGKSLPHLIADVMNTPALQAFTGNDSEISEDYVKKLAREVEHAMMARGVPEVPEIQKK